MELGISPIITSGLVMQVLAGARIIEVNNSVKEDRELFQGAQKLFAILITIGEAVAYVFSGMYGPLATLGAFNAILIILELLSIIVFIGGFVVMLWYAYTAWTNRWRWTGKAWSILLVIAAGMVLYVGLVFKLIGLTTNY